VPLPVLDIVDVTVSSGRPGMSDGRIHLMVPGTTRYPLHASRAAGQGALTWPLTRIASMSRRPPLAPSPNQPSASKTTDAISVVAATLLNAADGPRTAAYLVAGGLPQQTPSSQPPPAPVLQSASARHSMRSSGCTGASMQAPTRSIAATRARVIAPPPRT